MTKHYLQLLELIKLGIWPDYVVSPDVFQGCDWEAMYETVKVQAVLGVTFDGLQRLFAAHPEVCPDRKLLLRWNGQVVKLQNAYKKHVAVIGGVHRVLGEAGIKHVFMKGLTCGARYPHPDMRTCGDIDFVVMPKDFEATLKALERISTVDRTLVHEHHGMARVAGVVLEPHYKVHNYQNAKNDAAMADMFEEIYAEEFPTTSIFLAKCPETQDRDVTVHVPVYPPEFEGMFLVSHMVNHVYEEGLGLRQVIDFALWAKKCAAVQGFDKARHEAYLQRMRMMRPHRLFVRICEKGLGLPTVIFNYEYTSREKAFADKLMADILRVGNFGRGEYVFKHDSKWDDLKNYVWVTKRALRLGWLCPSEAYMWPLSKFTRYFSKIRHPERFTQPAKESE